MIAMESANVRVLERFGITFDNSWIPYLGRVTRGPRRASGSGGELVDEEEQDIVVIGLISTSLAMAAVIFDGPSMHPWINMASLLLGLFGIVSFNVLLLKVRTDRTNI
jgi:hypothetical protein